ncbi:MAG: ArsR/SmtB family transcription factor [Alphaproteobacteria bacterium]
MLQYLNIDRVFRSLADPTRRDMVETLALRPSSVSDLADRYDMSLSAVAQHLKVLEAGGLVTSKKDGRVRTCQVEAERLAELGAWVADRRTQLERRLDRLEAHLARGGTI